MCVSLWNIPHQTHFILVDVCVQTVLPSVSVAAARNEYLQRRHEANQYKLRAEKQLVGQSCLFCHSHMPALVWKRDLLMSLCWEFKTKNGSNWLLLSERQGLRPCTAESKNRKPGGQEQEVQPEYLPAPREKRQEGQQEGQQQGQQVGRTVVSRGTTLQLWSCDLF